MTSDRYASLYLSSNCADQTQAAEKSLEELKSVKVTSEAQVAAGSFTSHCKQPP
jgi:hypothetical protein